MRTHPLLDQRSLELHRLIADKLRREPLLFGRVHETLAQWQSKVSANAQSYVVQWRALADKGMNACIEVATQDSQEAAALRQASPLGGILTHKERFAFFREWAQRQNHDTR